MGFVFLNPSYAPCIARSSSSISAWLLSRRRPIGCQHIHVVAQDADFGWNALELRCDEVEGDRAVL
jgi:hypothetical protein